MMPNDDIAKLKLDKGATGARGRRRNRPFIIIAVLFLVLAGAFLFKTLFSPQVQIETTTVSLQYPSSAFTILNASGYVVAQRKAALAAKTTGRLEWLGVEEGSRVKSGEVIARLEAMDVGALRSQAVAALSSSTAQRDQAKVETTDAAKNLQRTKELFAQGVLSQVDFDSAQFRYEKGKAALAGAESNMNVSAAALEAANVAVDYTRIKAPFDGVVLTKNADVGDIVTPLGAAANAKASVVTIADLSSLKVEVDVSEASIEKVAKGQPCEILLDSLPQKRFRGEVHSIVPTADRSKATVMVKVGFLELDDGILPEMSAKVAFLERPVKTGEEQPKTVVSRNAIVRRAGQVYVYLLQGERVVETKVEIVDLTGDQVEIRSGVKPGDKIALKPLDKLKNGRRVKVVQK
jgi:RND family efflux transporter MFP subunit